jgi:hypothetical protein
MISSDLHGVEDPTRWMFRSHQGAEIGQRLIRYFALEKKRAFYQRHPDTAGPGEIDPLSVGCWL